MNDDAKNGENDDQDSANGMNKGLEEKKSSDGYNDDQSDESDDDAASDDKPTKGKNLNKPAKG